MDEHTDGLLDLKTRELLEKLIRLYQQDSEVLRVVARLARKADEFKAAMSEVEGRARQPGSDAPERSPSETLTADEWKSFCRKVEGSKLLRQLFATDPEPLSAADAWKVAALAQLADVMPDARNVLYTRDGAFMGVLAAALDRSMTAKDAEQLLTEDLVKIITLAEESPDDLADQLYDLAGSSYWHGVLMSLEDDTDYTANLGADAAQARQNFQKFQRLRQRLSAPTRLSRVPRRLYRLTLDLVNKLKEAGDKSVVPGKKSGPPAPAKQRTEQASDALKRLRAHEETRVKLENIEAERKLHFEVALHFITKRKFAKLDAFLYSWDEAARLAMSDYDGLVKVESGIVRPAPTLTTPAFATEEAQKLYELCMKDERLRRFLRLRPHFREIDPKELIQYRPAAISFEALESTTAGATVTTKSATPQTPAETAAATITPAPTGVVSASFEISRFTEKVTEGKGKSPSSPLSYRVRFSSPGSPHDAEVHLSTESLANEMLAFFNLSSVNAYLQLTQMLADPSSDLTSRVARGGQKLFEKFLGSSNIVKAIGTLLGDTTLRQQLRLSVKTDESNVANLPWEWLVLPDQSESMVLNAGYSLARNVNSGKTPTKPPPYLFPLRVLTVLSGQNELARREVERKWEGMKALFDKGEAIQLRMFRGEKDVAEELGVVLTEFRPHVLHFEATVSSPGSHTPKRTLKPSILLYNQDDQSYSLTLPRLREMLLDSDVNLIVFGDNPGGSFLDNPLLDLIAGLMRDGFLAAAVVPTRPVEEKTAQNFPRAFYRSWLGGQPLYAAVAGARVELRNHGDDWSAFALFGDSGALENLRLPPTLS
ncbi:MAG: CHAT domain-containing protein [Acidobacteria bacterium]|nr:CHAT domain-containing protein [Acidobacteriota bacterium]